MAEEFHVASLLVYVRPAEADRVAAAVQQLNGTEVHATSPEGKMIVTVESGDEQAINDCLTAIQTHPGVVSAALIYHEVEQGPAAACPPDAEPAQGHEPSQERAS